MFINDGSKDDSLSQLRKMAEAEPRYKVLSFARNFGHQVAITAGIDRAEGQAVVVMDADLQDPPEVVREMITLWRQGFNVVYWPIELLGSLPYHSLAHTFVVAAKEGLFRPLCGRSTDLRRSLASTSSAATATQCPARSKITPDAFSKNTLQRR